MASYVGSQRNPGHLLEAGEHVKRVFDPTRHKPIAAAVKAFLTTWSRYAAASKSHDVALVKEDDARSALADADAARDLAVLELERKLIVAGEPRMNGFKRFGAPSASRLVELRYADETKAVQKLVKAVLRQPMPAEVKKAAAQLTRANDAVSSAEQRVATVAARSKEKLRERDAHDRPLRAALSVLKLHVRIAEMNGLAGATEDFFAR